MNERPIWYEPHPVTPARKAELVGLGYKIIDAKFRPRPTTRVLPVAEHNYPPPEGAEPWGPSPGEEVEVALRAQQVEKYRPEPPPSLKPAAKKAVKKAAKKARG
jgi:hypothetical protein